MNGTTSPINRRQFIQTSAAAAAAFAILGCRPRKDKPNLLFIWTDQQRADTMAVYGNQKIDVPNLNKLAEQSIVFENAYVTQPVCTPSRSSVMTGLYPHSNGCIDNNIPLPASIRCLPELIADSDYRTAYFGKWHLGDELFAQHGFQEWVSIEDIYNQYFSPGRDKNKLSDYTVYLRSLGYEPDGERGEFKRMTAAKLPLEHCKPKFLERSACDFLRRHRNHPFILYVNFLEPHPPFTGPLDDKYNPEEIELPPNFADDLEPDEPLRYRLLRERYFFEPYKGDTLKTEADWRKLIARYWGLVSQVDLSVGAILKTLADLGLEDNTIVVFTSDHGDMMGSHRLLNKTVMYEEVVRVPWLMRIPQQGKRRQIMHGRFSHIDLLPTLLDAMGHKAELQGRSLLPLIKAEQMPVDDIFIEWNNKDRTDVSAARLIKATAEEIDRANGAFVRTVITQDGWKLCWSDKDKSQLFNLRKDPYETTNLFYLSGYEPIKAQLSEKIRRWQLETDDNLALT